MTRLEHDWFPSDLPGNVRIGEGSWLYSAYAFRHYRSQRTAGLTVGSRSGIYDGTFFDLGPGAEVAIGSWCTVVGAVFCTSKRVVIEDYVFLAHEVVLADTAFATPAEPEHAGSTSNDPAVSILVGESAWVGARAVLLEGARIGACSIVGAGAVVDFEVPPRCVVAGNPARIVRRLR